MSPDRIRYLLFPLQADDHVAFQSRRSLPLQNCDVWRAVSPVTAGPAAGHDVHVKVRCVLTGHDTVVLYEVDPVGIVCTDESVGHPADRLDHRLRLFVRQVEQGGGA